MCTKYEEYMEVVMLDICSFIERVMHCLQHPVCNIRTEYKFVVWHQLQSVLNLMDLALALFGPEVNKYYDYLEQLRDDWIELMELFRAMVSLVGGPVYMLLYLMAVDQFGGLFEYEDMVGCF